MLRSFSGGYFRYSLGRASGQASGHADKASAEAVKDTAQGGGFGKLRLNHLPVFYVQGMPTGCMRP